MSSSRHPQEARLHTDYIQISLATRALSQPSSLSCSPDVIHRKPGYIQTIQTCLATRALSQRSSLSCSPDVIHRKAGYIQTTYRSAWRRVHFRNLLHCRVLLTSSTESQATYRRQTSLTTRALSQPSSLSCSPDVTTESQATYRLQTSLTTRALSQPSSLSCSDVIHRKPGYIQTTDQPDDTCTFATFFTVVF